MQVTFIAMEDSQSEWKRSYSESWSKSPLLLRQDNWIWERFHNVLPGPFPWVLAIGEGLLRETKKDAFANGIQKLAGNHNWLHTKIYRVYHTCNGYHSEP